jgi:predicted Zn-dependent peptidase
VLYAEAFVSAYSDTGLFGFEVETLEGEEGAVLEALAGEIRALVKKPVPEAELAGAKRRLKLNILAGSEESDMRGHFLARQALFTGSVLDRNEYVKQVDGITAADVQAFLKKTVAAPTLVSEGNSARYAPLNQLKLK